MALNLQNYKRISGLTEKNTLNDSDVFAVDAAGDSASQKLSYSSLKTLLKTFFKLGDLSAGHYVTGSSFAGDIGTLDSKIYDQNDVIGDVLADLAPVQSTATAARAYAAGAYLVYQNQLYMVIADITQGATITPGTNVSAVTVGAVLVSAILSLADAHSSQGTYTEGDIVTHAGGLYICTSDTSGAWDADDWDDITVADLIGSVMSGVATIMAQINNLVLWFTNVTVSATTGTIVSKRDSRITADHVLASCVWANPSAIIQDCTWTTAAGSLTISGKCTTATTADICLVKKSN